MNKNKISKEGLDVKKENFSEWYSQILDKAELTDLRYNVKGFIVIRPWAARIIEKMYALYEEALQKRNHSPAFFPIVIPEKNFKKESHHVKGFKAEVFWLEKIKGEDKLALKPTGETAFYQMYSLWIRSHRDLPLKIYQRGTMYRYETKATRPLIRGRENYWIEAHDAFATKQEAEAQVQEDIKTTEEVMHQKFGIPFLPMKRPEWDKFAGAEYTIGSDVLMPDGKLIQQPSTHLLGQNFSKAFEIKFKDENGKEDYVWQTCYGPAISRILASIISMHGDDNGLVLPFCISPIKVVIVPIYKKENKTKVLKFAKDIQKKVKESYIDDRDYSPGWKFNEWELKGVPFRIEIGEKEIKEKKLMLFVRDTKEKKKISISDLKNFGAFGKDYDKRLLKKADKIMDDKIVDCASLEQIKKTIQNGKIAKVNWCSTGKEGIQCAEKIEKSIGAEVRGTMANKLEIPKGKCAVCGKKAQHIVYIGKSY